MIEMNLLQPAVGKQYSDDACVECGHYAHPRSWCAAPECKCMAAHRPKPAAAKPEPKLLHEHLTVSAELAEAIALRGSHTISYWELREMAAVMREAAAALGGHKHRCMRCGQEFDCRTLGICTAQYDVLPVVVLPDGTRTEHCPNTHTGGVSG